MTVTEPRLGRPARQRSYEELESIFHGIDAPFALVDLDALWANAAELLGRAQGTPIRVASKSVRCRSVLASILERDPGFSGLMTFTLGESLWLHDQGFGDLLLAYPTADRAGLARLARLQAERPPIVMVDSVEQLDFIEAAAAGGPGPIAVCIDLDLGWWPLGGRLKIGAKRSPLRTPAQARTLAETIAARPLFELRALMGYEAHIAGLGDEPEGKRLARPLIRFMKRRSSAEIAERRAAVVAAVREVAEVPIVNGGGTGSVHLTTREPVVTEDHGRLGVLRPHPVRPLLVVSPHPRRDVRDAGGATPERRGGHAARRRLSGVGRGGSRPPSAAAPAARAQARRNGGCRRGPDAGDRSGRR